MLSCSAVAPLEPARHAYSSPLAGISALEIGTCAGSVATA
ncbi:hypothetical protein NOCA1190111 [metagenome]|uniref:Uncharacterized protein n=1 Tax=metagenome TaxID=256318 RepID=A0A2P2CCV8_9ZZZZ